MRDYVKEGKELESLMRSIGLLTEHNEKDFSLADMVDFYGVAYMQYGPLRGAVEVTDPAPPPTQQAEPLPWEDVAAELPIEVFFEPESDKTITLPLSDDQKDALEKLKVWLYNDEPYFTLRGFAGTGKTYLLQMLNDFSISIYYSAPTNKAAKVLGAAVGRVAKTTYSMLGLRMEQSEDELVLVQSSTPPYFPARSILVVDEAGTAGSVLCDAIEDARQRCRIKILYVGDPAQLNPVKEKTSPAWRKARKPECRAMLKQVMRYDNELLVLATELRECIKQKNWHSPLRSNHTDTGVWKWKTKEQFEKNLIKSVRAGNLDNSKVIAWRNKTVDYYNSIIREALGFRDPYCVGDRLLLAEPIEESGTLIAHTDDEYGVVNVHANKLNVDGVGIATWQLELKGDQELIVDVPQDVSELDRVLAQKARVARASTGQGRRIAWQEFWSVKSMFQKVRYGNALTAHRAQGSTYTNIWLDQMDILANRDKREAFRCLYVGATRPTTNLYSY